MHGDGAQVWQHHSIVSAANSAAEASFHVEKPELIEQTARLMEVRVGLSRRSSAKGIALSC